MSIRGSRHWLKLRNRSKESHTSYLHGNIFYLRSCLSRLELVCDVPAGVLGGCAQLLLVVSSVYLDYDSVRFIWEAVSRRFKLVLIRNSLLYI